MAAALKNAVARIGATLTTTKNMEALQMLDGLKVFSVSLKPPLHGWQRVVWLTALALATWQLGSISLNVGRVLAHSESVSLRAWYVTMIIGMLVVLVFNLIVRYYADSVQEVRQFIESKFVISGDVSSDATERSVFARQAKLCVSVMFVGLLLDQILFSIPNSQRAMLFIDPLNRTQEKDSLYNHLFLDTYAIVWMSKYFWSFGSLSVLLLGLRCEQKILARRFENDLLRMKSLLCSEHFDSKHYFYRWQARDAFWKQLKADVRLTLEQHLELVRIIELLQAPIGMVFLFFYIYAIIGFGTVIFVVMKDPLTLVSVVLLITQLSVVIQGFIWCWLNECFQDTNELIHATVYEMCALLPYDDEHCSSYRQMRSSLMIIATRLVNGDGTSCVGIGDITVDLFTNMLDISYDMLKFLLGLRK